MIKMVEIVGKNLKMAIKNLINMPQGVNEGSAKHERYILKGK